MRTRIVLAAACMAASSLASAERLHPRPLPALPRIELTLAQPIRAETKTLVFTNNFMLEPGTYPVNKEVAFQGTNYYLLPIKHCDMHGCAINNHARDLSGGSMLLVQMLMVNEKDGSVLDRDLYLANDGAAFGTDKDGNAYVLKGGLKMTAGNPSLQITQVSETEVRSQQAQVAHARALAEEQRRQQSAALNPEKRKVGTRICQPRGEWIAIGYTEAVSPDNGKIQIRIADEQGVNAPSIHPGGFQPSIIWDDPTNWELCDLATP